MYQYLKCGKVIFSVAVPPPDVRLQYQNSLETVGFGEGVEHRKLDSGDEGKAQFVAIFNKTKSKSGLKIAMWKTRTTIGQSVCVCDLLEVVKIGVFSCMKNNPAAVAWEVYGRDDDKVTYHKSKAEWAFGKITAYRP